MLLHISFVISLQQEMGSDETRRDWTHQVTKSVIRKKICIFVLNPSLYIFYLEDVKQNVVPSFKIKQTAFLQHFNVRLEFFTLCYSKVASYFSEIKQSLGFWLLYQNSVSHFLSTFNCKKSKWLEYFYTVKVPNESQI